MRMSRRRRPPPRFFMRSPHSDALHGVGRRILLILVLGVMIFVMVQAVRYLRELSRAIALSDATDIMTLCISDAVTHKTGEDEYGYDYFVSLEKSDVGGITAVKTNMARINAFSAELLSAIVHSADNGRLKLAIPLGDLLGSSLLLGKGPDVPVEITMLTSSRVDCRNELESAGINQTKHQIKLDVLIDIDVILPWETASTQVFSEVLIAETVIVGSVPETYFNLE